MIHRFNAMISIAMAGIVVAALAASVGAQAPAAQQPPAAAPAGPPPPCGPGINDKNVAPDSRCFELRTYTVRPEGPGSIDLLHSRFREHTNRLFRKHGMTIVGFWHPTNKPNTLIYILAYKDRAARDAAWKAFQSDPEWAKVRTEMQVGTQVESVFMSSTDYGPMK
jgi:NIPSNAP protein